MQFNSNAVVLHNKWMKVMGVSFAQSYFDIFVLVPSQGRVGGGGHNVGSKMPSLWCTDPISISFVLPSGGGKQAERRAGGRA